MIIGVGIFAKLDSIEGGKAIMLCDRNPSSTIHEVGVKDLWRKGVI